MEYRRRKKSDTWHFDPQCRWWPKLGEFVIATARPRAPSHGELCNACRSRAKAAK